MKSEFYNVTLNILSVVSLFAGIVMFFFSSEHKKKFVTYKRSRYLAGIVFLLYALLCFVHSNFELRSISKIYGSAFSLSIYYISALLFGYSLIPLLNKHYFNRRRIILDGIRYFIFLLFIAGSILLAPPYSKIALALSAIYFFVDALRIATLFVKSYRRCANDIDNYYSEYNVKSYVDWMYRVSILIAIYGLSFTFIFYSNSLLITIFSFFGIFLMVYIVISYNNYLMFVEKIDLSQEDSFEKDDELIPTIIESLSYAEIGNELESWIKKKGFLTEGITIAMLCVELNTNRTYLSSYINKNYNYSFREFVSALRIEEAKRLLKQDNSRDIGDIASITGFSSASNFYRTFKKYEDETPHKYRQK